MDVVLCRAVEEEGRVLEFTVKANGMNSNERLKRVVRMNTSRYVN